MTGDALKATAELNQVLGNPYLIVPSLTVEGAEAWKAMAVTFNEIAAKAGALGARVGYHAHQWDFRKLGDTTPWEIFFDNTGRDVIMQIDTGNCMQGGGDPVAMLKKYPGRSTTVHLKDFGGTGETVIGEGQVRWDEVFDACEGAGPQPGTSSSTRPARARSRASRAVSKGSERWGAGWRKARGPSYLFSFSSISIVM